MSSPTPKSVFIPGSSVMATRSSNVNKAQDGSLIYKRRHSLPLSTDINPETPDKTPSATTLSLTARSTRSGGKKVRSRYSFYSPQDSAVSKLSDRKRSADMDSSSLGTVAKRRRTIRTKADGKLIESDAFCWICHLEGDADDRCCDLCPRLYHTKCLISAMKYPGNNESGQPWVCPECEKIMKAESPETCSKAMKMITNDVLCSLLRFAIQRMKYPDSEPFFRPVDCALVPHYTDYVFNPMDFASLEKNIKKKLYGSTEALVADCKWILHNTIVFNGKKHKLTNVARTVMKICKHEASEIEVCPDCYLNSCTKPSGDWFCEPCRIAHTIVWAKMKGYPFWPAKVLREENGQVDVRFFGEHDRAWVPVSQVFMISESPPSMLKTRKGFDVAIAELHKHVEKLREKFGSFSFAENRTPYNPQEPYNKPNLLTPTNRSYSAARFGLSKRKKKKSDTATKTGRVLSADNGADHPPVKIVVKLSSSSAASKTASAVKLKYSSIISTRRSSAKKTDAVSTDASTTGAVSSSLVTDDASPGRGDTDTITLNENGNMETVDGDVSSGMGKESSSELACALETSDTPQDADVNLPAQSVVQHVDDDDKCDKVGHAVNIKMESLCERNHSSEISVQASDIETHSECTSTDQTHAVTRDHSASPSNLEYVRDGVDIFDRVSPTHPVDSNTPSGDLNISSIVAETENEHLTIGGCTENVISSESASNTVDIKHATIIGVVEPQKNVMDRGDKLSGFDVNPVDRAECLATSETDETVVSLNAKCQSSYLPVDNLSAVCPSSVSQLQSLTEPIDASAPSTDLSMTVNGSLSCTTSDIPDVNVVPSVSLSLTCDTQPSISCVSAVASLISTATSDGCLLTASHVSLPSHVDVHCERETETADADDSDDDNLILILDDDEVDPGEPAADSLPVQTNTSEHSEQIDIDNQDGRNSSILELTVGSTSAMPAVSASDVTVSSSFEPMVSPTVGQHLTGTTDAIEMQCPSEVLTSLSDAVHITEAPTVIVSAITQRIPMATVAPDLISSTTTSEPDRQQIPVSAAVTSENHTQTPSCEEIVTPNSADEMLSVDSHIMSENSQISPPVAVTVIQTAVSDVSPAQSHCSGLSPATSQTLLASSSSPSLTQPLNLTADSAVGSATFQFNMDGFDYSKFANMLHASTVNMLEEFTRDLLNGNAGSALRRHMQLEVSRLKHQHAMEIAEIRHNFAVRMAELRFTLEQDRDAAIEELREQFAREKEQMIRDKEQEILETKRRQWCANCGKEAIFYCCWNTTYCDYSCQKAHWPQHMDSCTQPLESSQSSRDFHPSQYNDLSAARNLASNSRPGVRYQADNRTQPVGYSASAGTSQFIVQPPSYTISQPPVQHLPLLQVQFGQLQNTVRPVATRAPSVGMRFITHQSSPSGGGMVVVRPGVNTQLPQQQLSASRMMMMPHR